MFRKSVWKWLLKWEIFISFYCGTLFSFYNQSSNLSGALNHQKGEFSSVCSAAKPLLRASRSNQIFSKNTVRNKRLRGRNWVKVWWIRAKETSVMLAEKLLPTREMNPRSSRVRPFASKFNPQSDYSFSFLLNWIFELPLFFRNFEFYSFPPRNYLLPSYSYFCAAIFLLSIPALLKTDNLHRLMLQGFHSIFYFLRQRK